MERFLLILMLVLCTALGAALFFDEDKSKPKVKDDLPNEKEQEFLLLQAENQFLKRMLGQVEGKVWILGPTSSGGKGYAKVVWDESLQTGYFYATQLPLLSPSEVYQLSMGVKGKPLVLCRTFSPEAGGRVQFSFNPSVRSLGVNEMTVTVEKGAGGSPPRGTKILESAEP